MYEPLIIFRLPTSFGMWSSSYAYSDGWCLGVTQGIWSRHWWFQTSQPAEPANPKIMLTSLSTKSIGPVGPISTTEQPGITLSTYMIHNNKFHIKQQSGSADNYQYLSQTMITRKQTFAKPLHLRIKVPLHYLTQMGDTLSRGYSLMS